MKRPRRLNRRTRRLVEEHLAFAKWIAIGFRQRVTWDVTVDEMISLAYIGLIEAALRFDPQRDISFRTFAKSRIRGAVIDGIRSQVEMTRSQIRPGRRTVRLSEALHAVPATQRDDLIRLDELHRDLPWLAATVKALPRRERGFLHDVYMRDRQLMVAGRRIGLTKSGASRLHKSLLRRLNQLYIRRPEFRSSHSPGSPVPEGRLVLT